MGKGLINGGYFVFDKKMLSYLTEDEDCDFEFGPLQEIAESGQLKQPYESELDVSGN